MNNHNEMLSSTGACTTVTLRLALTVELWIVEGDELPPVKFQPIKKEGKTIVVGRVKVPTVSHSVCAHRLRLTGHNSQMDMPMCYDGTTQAPSR